MVFLLSPKSPFLSPKETSNDCIIKQSQKGHRQEQQIVQQQNKMPSKIKHFAMQRRKKERKMELLQWSPQENRSSPCECPSSNCSFKPNLLAKVPNTIPPHFHLYPGLFTLAPGGVLFCGRGSYFQGECLHL